MPRFAKITPLLVWVLCVVAFAVRVAVALRHPFFLPDSADYQKLAEAIRTGSEYQIDGAYATRMPGYPIFMAAIQKLFGPSQLAVLLIQAAMGALCVPLIYQIGKRAAPAIGLTAAALMVFDPLSVAFSASLLSEIPFTFFFLLALWLVVLLCESPRRLEYWQLLGVFWAIAIYLRASCLWLIIPLIALVWCFGRPQKHRLQNPATAPRPGENTPMNFRLFLGSGMAILLVLVGLWPWWQRNYSLFHEHYFRMSTHEGISLYEAVYPDADGGPKQDILIPPASWGTLGESALDNAWSRAAWGYIRTDPLRIAKLAVIKIGRTWSPWLNAKDFQQRWINVISIAWHGPVFLLAMAGLFLGKLPRRLIWLLLVPIIYYTAVHALFLGSVRYRVPLMPLVDLLAAGGITAILHGLFPKWNFTQIP